MVAHAETDAITAPGELGEFELLPGHVPMLTSLRPGVLTIGEKQRARYAVSSGYLRVAPEGTVEILVEQATPAAQVDTDKARKELREAESDLAKWAIARPDGDWQNLMHRVQWAQACLDAAAS
ncbi:MAG: ATP synthase F1 subunit epsilon [Myxococcales bacterium]|nr:ATP synthase F1 subunit epsilon [Myxococcales bacterium]